LQRLLNAFADGLNFYLYRHPEVKPRVITRFEPWMAPHVTRAASAAIERVSPAGLAGLLWHSAARVVPESGDGLPAEPGAGRTASPSPGATHDHHALLWINPHVALLPLGAADGERGGTERLRAVTCG
jgi:acyl-homoserine-lactone acylase